jgi:hypothetical protein
MHTIGLSQGCTWGSCRHEPPGAFLGQCRSCNEFSSICRSGHWPASHTGARHRRGQSRAANPCPNSSEPHRRNAWGLACTVASLVSCDCGCGHCVRDGGRRVLDAANAMRLRVLLTSRPHLALLLPIARRAARPRPPNAEPRPGALAALPGLWGAQRPSLRQWLADMRRLHGPTSPQRTRMRYDQECR